MNTITISKKITKGEELIVVSRKEYENLLRAWLSTERLTKKEAHAVKSGLRQIENGNFFTSKQVKHALGI